MICIATLSVCRAANLPQGDNFDGGDDDNDDDRPVTLQATDYQDPTDAAGSELDDEIVARAENSFAPGEHLLEPHVLDTNNIENAKLAYTSSELETAAGHHHHHHHHVHGKLDMGAHTGKKGSFGWHSKHPVGGKGRR